MKTKKQQRVKSKERDPAAMHHKCLIKINKQVIVYFNLENYNICISTLIHAVFLQALSMINRLSVVNSIQIHNKYGCIVAGDKENVETKAEQEDETSGKINPSETEGTLTLW